jgi:hypothetical protein
VRQLLVCLLCSIAVLAQDTGKPAGTPPRPSQRRADAILNNPEFDADVAGALLSRIGEGLTALSSRTVLSVFDRGHDPDHEQVYMRVKEQTIAWFDASREIRVHYVLQDWSVENGEAIVKAKFEIEQYPASSDGEPSKRNGILQLHAQRTKAGWRIVAYDPEGFFLP